MMAYLTKIKNEPQLIFNSVNLNILGKECNSCYQYVSILQGNKREHIAVTVVQIQSKYYWQRQVTLYVNGCYTRNQYIHGILYKPKRDCDQCVDQKTLNHQTLSKIGCQVWTQHCPTPHYSNINFFQSFILIDLLVAFVVLSSKLSALF